MQHQTPTRYAELINNVRQNDGFIRQKTLLQELVPFSASTLWRLVNAGKFPIPVKVTKQITAWRVSEVQEWSKNPAGYTAQIDEVAI